MLYDKLKITILKYLDGYQQSVIGDKIIEFIIMTLVTCHN